MIKYEDGRIECAGRGVDLVVECTSIVRSIYERFVEEGLPEDCAKKFMCDSLELAFLSNKELAAKVSDVLTEQITKALGLGEGCEQ